MGGFEPGQTIDGFEMVERMKSGGMASLWRAKSPAHDFPVLLKVPFLDPGEDVSAIVGYEVEELILKRLAGPHVPRFVGSGDLDRIPYIAMEFVEGESLATLAGRAPLASADVQRIGIEIATALSSLHGQKVVHLDLKPENVILVAGRGAVLLDYGLARHAELPDFLGEESSVPMGTAAYIAPEQVLGERSDPASDIFALGCILYQLAAGVEPFGRPQTTAGMKRRLYHEAAPLRELNSDVPQWLEAVVARCMAVDRAWRYAEAAQVAFDLRHPEQVSLRVHPDKPRGGGFFDSIRRLFSRPSGQAIVGRARDRAGGGGPAIVLAAVDLASGQDTLSQEVLATTGRVLASRPDSLLTCLTVLKTEILADTPATDSEGRSTYLRRLVALREWARPLHLPEHRISYHVIEAVNPADAILSYAERNDVGHIAIGARASSAMRRHLGSVSAKVVAEALCSVSVVRLKAVRRDEAAE